jgi:predicted nucleic acid-binding protein
VGEAADEEELLCNNYVVIETYALVQARLGMDAVRALTTELMPALRILWVDAELHSAALTALITAVRRQLSLVDCTSFETMRRLNVRRAFTFDDHFAEQGFEVVP